MNFMDPRKQRTQQLFWEVEALQKQGWHQAALPKLLEMACLHEEYALERLNAGKLDGWIDLFAAITAWGEAGRRTEADRLLVEGSRFASTYDKGRENLEHELQELKAWLDSLPARPPTAAPNGALPSRETRKV
jgi:hypothetical protein